MNRPLTISQLIIELARLQKQYGDLKVFVWGNSNDLIAIEGAYEFVEPDALSVTMTGEKIIIILFTKDQH